MHPVLRHDEHRAPVVEALRERLEPGLLVADRHRGRPHHEPVEGKNMCAHSPVASSEGAVAARARSPSEGPEPFRKSTKPHVQGPSDSPCECESQTSLVCIFRREGGWAIAPPPPAPFQPRIRNPTNASPQRLQEGKNSPRVKVHIVASPLAPNAEAAAPLEVTMARGLTLLKFFINTYRRNAHQKQYLPPQAAPVPNRDRPQRTTNASQL